MRILRWAFLCLGLAAPLLGQDTRDLLPPDQYGIPSSPKIYPQASPKEALETVTKLLESRRYDYLLAHVVDPAFVKSKVEERAQRYRPGVDREYQILRDEQQRNIDRYERDVLLPLDPAEFAARVDAEATRRAFKQLQKEVEAHFADYPETPRLFRKMLREGTINDMGGNVSFSHKDVPWKFVNFKRDGKRWFMEDRQQEDLKAPPPSPKDK